MVGGRERFDYETHIEGKYGAGKRRERRSDRGTWRERGEEEREKNKKEEREG